MKSYLVSLTNFFSTLTLELDVFIRRIHFINYFLSLASNCRLEGSFELIFILLCLLVDMYWLF